jgi:hypothetical protein
MPNEQERPSNQDADACSKDCPFAMHSVDHSSRPKSASLQIPTRLTSERNHTAQIPSARSKLGRQESPKPGLHIGEEKVQPLDLPQTQLRSVVVSLAATAEPQTSAATNDEDR